MLLGQAKVAIAFAIASFVALPASATTRTVSPVRTTQRRYKMRSTPPHRETLSISIPAPTISPTSCSSLEFR
jgi:hypothetical protein